jgi:hypothetical protein
LSLPVIDQRDNRDPVAALREDQLDERHPTHETNPTETV